MQIAHRFRTQTLAIKTGKSMAKTVAGLSSIFSLSFHIVSNSRTFCFSAFLSRFGNRILQDSMPLSRASNSAYVINLLACYPLCDMLYFRLVLFCALNSCTSHWGNILREAFQDCRSMIGWNGNHLIRNVLIASGFLKLKVTQQPVHSVATCLVSVLMSFFINSQETTCRLNSVFLQQNDVGLIQLALQTVDAFGK